jgi:hypothetical protein
MNVFSSRGTWASHIIYLKVFFLMGVQEEMEYTYHNGERERDWEGGYLQRGASLGIPRDRG